MSLSEGELAGRLINWRARFENKYVTWPAGGELNRRFADHLADHLRNLHSDDLRILVDQFVTRHQTLIDWYEVVLNEFDKSLVFQDGAPKLRVGALTQWRRVTGYLDPDALVALRLAKSLARSSTAEGAVTTLPHWGYYLTMADHGLDQMLGRGTADIHVHFEASDPMPLLWLRIATGRVQVNELQYYSRKALNEVKGDIREYDRRKRDRKILSEAAARRAKLCDCLNVAPLLDEADFREKMVHERRLLVGAWRHALGAPDEDFLSTLDGYLFAKNLFVRRHQQRAGLGPGLDRFRDFLDRGETLAEKRAKKFSPRVRRDRFERMLSLATESRSLHRLELRIAPPDKLKGWYDFFKLWHRAFGQDGPLVERKIDVKFTVHFIRKPKSKPTSSCDMQFGDTRQRLDRQTAIFHLFRHNCPELAQYVTGIDVANIERGSPPEIFVPYLKLLRGDGPLGDDLDRDAFRYWQRLDERDLGLPPQNLPRLGLTYHAGEDFHHPVDGMRAISGLLETILQPGDRIGHGLAVGLDVDRFRDKRGFGPMPQGVLLDNLVWLRREASQLGCWTGERQRRCDRLILDLSHKIYAKAYSDSALERALTERFNMPRNPKLDLPKGQEPRPEAEIVWREADEGSIRDARAAFANPEDCKALQCADGVIKAVQNHVIGEIRRKGIMVEANPSSNQITDTVESLAHHPYFQYLSALNNDVIVGINTDDPGVFGTTIEIEFGLMFEAMLEARIDRATSLKLLGQSRRLAFDYAFRSSAEKDRDTARRP